MVRPPRRMWVTALALVGLAMILVGPPPAAAQGGRPAVTLWTPEYSAPLYLPLRDDAMSVVADPGGGVWLAGELATARFAAGQWDAPQQLPGGGSLFALAPSGQDAWAFGFEGAMWQRVAGRWWQRASPTNADLYAAATRGPGETWAVGFDYASEHGTVVRVTSAGIEAITWPGLYRRQLFSLAVAPDGTLWAGGCSYEDEPFLLRGDGVGPWQPVAVPLAGGCVLHLSFASAGHGLAAAGSDILAWNGSAWRAMGQPPPAGLQWLRVAALDNPPGSPDAMGEPTGWAVPGTPNWHGYRSGAVPWYFDGDAWDEGVVDYGPYARPFTSTEEPGGSRLFVGLAADEGIAWTVSMSVNGLVGLVRLEAGTGRLWHPALEVAHDVAALPDGTLWVAGGGPTPLLGRVAGSWRAGVLAGEAERLEFRLVDLAGPRSGWALARDPEASYADLSPWRWDGQRWSAVAVPDGWELRRVRALPNGGAWAVDQWGRLVAWQNGIWSAVPGAPTVELATASDMAPNVRLPTPFDVAGDAEEWVACVASGDVLYRYEDGVFDPVPNPGGARFMDLQLVDVRHGWALPTELMAEQLSAQVARLTDCRAEPVGVAGLPGWPLGPFQAMAPSRSDAVWLYRGDGRVPGRAQLVAYRVGEPRAFLAAGERCAVRGMAAVPEAAHSGSDLWLAGGPWTGTAFDACGPVAPPPAAPHFSLLSRLRLHLVAGTLLLPSLLRNQALSLDGR